MNGSIRTDYDRIAEKIGPGIMLNDPLVVGHMLALRGGFITVEDALVSCIRSLSVLCDAYSNKAIRAAMFKAPPQILIVTEERFEELQKEMGR